MTQPTIAGVYLENVTVHGNLLVIDDVWHADAAGLLRCGGPGCAHLLTTRNQAIARQFAGAG